MDDAVNKLVFGSRQTECQVQTFQRIFHKLQANTSLSLNNIDKIVNHLICCVDNEAIIDAGADLLWNLAYQNSLPISPQVQNSLATPQVFDLVNSLATKFKSNESIIRSVCGILSSLCNNEAHRGLVDRQTLQCLCECLASHCQDFSLVPFILDAISCCCASNSTNVAVVSSCGVARLITAVWQLHTAQSPIAESCCHCLTILSDYDTVSSQLYSVGCVSCVLSCFRHQTEANQEVMKLAIIVLLRTCHENGIAVKQMVVKGGVRDLLLLLPFVLQFCETDIITSYMQLIYASTNIKLLKKLGSSFIEKQLWAINAIGGRDLLVAHILPSLALFDRKPNLLHISIQVILNCVLLSPIIRDMEARNTSSYLCHCCNKYRDNSKIVDPTIEYVKLVFRTTCLSDFCNNPSIRDSAIVGLLVCSDSKCDDLELMTATITCVTNYCKISSSVSDCSDFLRHFVGLLNTFLLKMEYSAISVESLIIRSASVQPSRNLFDICNECLQETKRLFPQEIALHGLLDRCVSFCPAQYLYNKDLNINVTTLNDFAALIPDSRTKLEVMESAVASETENSINSALIVGCIEETKIKEICDETIQEEMCQQDTRINDAVASSEEEEEEEEEKCQSHSTVQKPQEKVSFSSFQQIATEAQERLLTLRDYPESYESVTTESFALIFPPPRSKVVYQNFSYPIIGSMNVADNFLSNFYPKTNPLHNFEESVVFDSSFESSNLLCAIQRDDYEYDLLLRSDTNTGGHAIWYYFGVRSNFASKRTVRLNIVNISKPNALYTNGMRPLVFSHYERVAGNACWKRAEGAVHFVKNDTMVYTDDVSSIYQNFRLSYTLSFDIECRRGGDVNLVCHAFPYTYSDNKRDLQSFINKAPKSTKLVQLRKIQDKFDLFALAISDGISSIPDVLLMKKNVIFLSGRVHPAETPGSWIMRGIIEFFLSDSEEAVYLREKYLIMIVPMLNPDGVAIGNTRCNFHGVDLNRQWKSPSSVLHESILAAKNLLKCLQSNVGEIVLFMDLHGHNRRFNSFFYGCSDTKPLKCNPKYLPRLISKNTISQNFMRYEDCTFDIKPDRDTTARAIVFREFGVSCSYTLETSFFGSNFGRFKQRHYSPHDLQVYGSALCDSVYELLKHYPELEICPYNEQSIVTVQGMTLTRCLSPDISPSMERLASPVRRETESPTTQSERRSCITFRSSKLPLIAPRSNIGLEPSVLREIVDETLKTISYHDKDNVSVKKESPAKKWLQPVKPTVAKKRSFRSEPKTARNDLDMMNGALDVKSCMQIQPPTIPNKKKKAKPAIKQILELDDSIGKLSNSQMSVFSLSSTSQGFWMK